jgi:hypothetical protein
MAHLWRSLLGLTLSFGLAVGAHAAIITYTLDDVVFSDGGQASGWFSTNSTTGDVVAFDVATTTGSALQGALYNAATSYVYCNRCNSPPNSFAIDLDNNSRYIAMTFLDPLTSYGRDPVEISTGYYENYECLDCNPYRVIVSGAAVSVASVPEPASWAIMLVGLCGVGAALRSSRRTLAAMGRAALFVVQVIMAR